MKYLVKTHPLAFTEFFIPLIIAIMGTLVGIMIVFNVGWSVAALVLIGFAITLLVLRINNCLAWWYPFILGIISLLPLFLSETSPSAQWRYTNLIFFILSFTFVILILFAKFYELWNGSLRLYPAVILLLLYSTLAMLSLFTPYTEVNSKIEAFAHILQLFISLLFVWLLLSSRSVRANLITLDYFISGLFWGTFLLSTLGVVLSGQSGGMERFGDMKLLHPNVLGYNAGIATSLAFLNFRYSKKHRPFYLIVLFISSIVLLSTFSKTSIIVTVLTLIILASISEKSLCKKLKNIILITIIGTIVTIPLYHQLQRWYELYTSNKYTVYTLSRRIPLWQISLQLISRNPVFGYGYSSSWDLLAMHIPWEQAGLHAHNDILNSLINVGILGTIPLVIVVMWTGFSLLRLSLRCRSDSDFHFSIIKVLSIYLLMLGQSFTGAWYSIFGFGIVILCFVSVSSGVLCELAESRLIKKNDYPM